MIRQKQERENIKATRVHGLVQILARYGGIQASEDTALDFISEFAELSRRSPPKKTGGVGVDLTAFEKLMVDIGMSLADCMKISELLLRTGDEANRYLGKRLLFTLSDRGTHNATLSIMNHAWQANKARPGTLKSSEIVHARKHLHKIATEEESYRAMVLEGKIAYTLGEVDYAIQMWTQAMDAAVAAAEEGKPFRAIGLEAPDDRKAGVDMPELSSPWIELGTAYLLRRDYVNARWAISIGCDQDDPTSHYSAALLEKRYNESDQHIGTSVWLYHMTKAAASGYPKAAHELGVWYGSNGWKYIEDEPPDHVKPTPFDSYPPDLDVKSAGLSLMDMARVFLGLVHRVQENPKEQVFHTAAFPFTPLDRYKMALEWLEVSMAFTYAPSYLFAARLLLEKTLWPDVAAPKEALELSDKRYTYASKANYEAGQPIKRPDPANDPAPKEIKNPLYNPDLAKSYVREVFYALAAQGARVRMLRGVQGLRQTGTYVEPTFDADELLKEDQMPESINPDVKKWFRFPEIREMYSDDVKRRLYDDSLEVDLEVEARLMCEEQGWDIYAEDGGLLYKHGLNRR